MVEAEARPAVTLNARYTTDRSLTSLPAPITSFPDSGRALTFGVSIGLPVFNRNQGAKADAAVAITQSQQRRTFIEAVIRAEVSSAFTRQQAAQRALAAYEQGALTRSQDNIRAIRSAYEVGAFKITELLAETTPHAGYAKKNLSKRLLNAPARWLTCGPALGLSEVKEEK